MLDSTNISVILAAIAAVGGKEAWSYHKRKAILNSAEKMKDKELSSLGDGVIKKELRELLDKQISDLRSDNIKLKEDLTASEKEVTEMTVKNAILTERLLSYSQKSRGTKKLINNV